MGTEEVGTDGTFPLFSGRHIGNRNYVSSEGDTMSQFRFEPWAGKSYRHSSFGIRIVVLGESHYGAAKNPRLTINIIEDECDGGSGFKFYTNVVASFLGTLPNAGQRKQFWHSVVFYNYLQGFAGARPRTPPAYGMWAKSEQNFRRVIDKYKPHLIAVFGFGLWEELPNWGHDADPIVLKRLSVPCYNFALLGGSALAPKLRHPSSGFNFRTWHPVVREAVRRAGGTL